VTSEEAVEFLRMHQPMPPEEELSEDLITRFDEARRALEREPDPRGLPLLLNSLGEGSGLGVYQLLDNTLRAYDADAVVQALVVSLGSSLPSVRSWSMEFALDYPDPRLVLAAIALLRSDDPDARYFAAAFLVEDWVTDPVAQEALRDAALHEDDPGIREVLSEADGPPGS
jgi:hypothetical protein